MTTIRTEILIAAPPDAVWAELTDFACYAAWNPSIPRARGTATPGTQIELRVRLPGGLRLTVRPVIVRADPGRELRWCAGLRVPGLLEAEHAFVLERTAAGIRLIQTESFTGLLSRLFVYLMGPGLRRAYEQTNAALKRRVEQVPASACSGPAGC